MVEVAELFLMTGSRLYCLLPTGVSQDLGCLFVLHRTGMFIQSHARKEFEGTECRFQTPSFLWPSGASSYHVDCCCIPEAAAPI